MGPTVILREKNGTARNNAEKNLFNVHENAELWCDMDGRAKRLEVWEQIIGFD